MLKGTFAFEGCGAIILSLRFIHDFGVVGGIYRGIFTSVSAFCNAGFDLMGRESPFCSLAGYTDDIVVNITVTLLIIIGGLGFLVWEEVLTVRKFSKYSLSSKMVLIGTGLLIVTGAAFVFLFENTNPETMGDMSLKGKLLGSYFQSVSFRTAGFSTINLAGLKECTVVIAVVYMFIGGASGSCLLYTSLCGSSRKYGWSSDISSRETPAFSTISE